MHASVTFQDFIAASPHTDPVDRKKLLFVYRAVEDFAAERRSSAADFSILEAAYDAGGVKAPLERLGARVRAITGVEDALTFRDDARYDVIVVSDMIGRVPDPDALLENMVRHLAPDGLVIVTTPNGYGRRWQFTRGKLFDEREQRDGCQGDRLWRQSGAGEVEELADEFRHGFHFRS